MRSSSVEDNLLKVSFFLALYFDTPAACSNKRRRESSLSFKISSIIFNSMMAYKSALMPVSINKLVMSLSRHFTSLSRYSLSPLRYKMREMVTVENSVGSRFRVFSNVKATSARPAALRFLVPLNKMFSIFSKRKARPFCSPSTQRMASTVLDLPQPLGPTMPVRASLKWMVVLSAKLLNPLISNVLSCTVFIKFGKQK